MTPARPNLSFGPEIVMIPGPSVMPQRVLAAMARPMPDIYQGELIDVSNGVLQALPRLARTRGDAYIAVSNGHGAWEMALTNTLSKGDRVLVADCGVFAAVWGEMARALGLDVEVLRAPEGRAVSPDVIGEALAADRARSIKAILLVQVDTASSVRNDIAAVRAAIDAAGHPALLMVDAIASLGCEPFEMDAWGVDVTVGASQKGLMTPPGLGFVWANDKAWEAHQRADLRTGYWDWTPRRDPEAHYLRYCGTPPVSHLMAVHEAIKLIDEEGLENAWARHATLAGAVRAAVDAWSTPDGLGLYGREPSERANSVTTIRTGAVDAEQLRKVCQTDFGVTLGIGLRTFAGQAFRIGHMGHVNAPAVLGVLGVIEAALARLGVETAGSGLAAAAAALA